MTTGHCEKVFGQGFKKDEKKTQPRGRTRGSVNKKKKRVQFRKGESADQEKKKMKKRGSNEKGWGENG